MMNSGQGWPARPGSWYGERRAGRANRITWMVDLEEKRRCERALGRSAVAGTITAILSGRP
jgi:hypothetical protein